MSEGAVTLCSFGSQAVAEEGGCSHGPGVTLGICNPAGNYATQNDADPYSCENGDHAVNEKNVGWAKGCNYGNTAAANPVAYACNGGGGAQTKGCIDGNLPSFT